ncbi:hypothetical protein [Streptomyces sp. NPDC048277]|uniref:hypothetical protein n=1 Tax=Streptomyces sp. NPDC048277 TaxID=3155027 RepID=UPI0033E12C43
MNDLGSRTPQEIFQSHGKTLLAEDLDGIVANYGPGAAITPDGVRHGRDGVREGSPTPIPIGLSTAWTPWSSATG